MSSRILLEKNERKYHVAPQEKQNPEKSTPLEDQKRSPNQDLLKNLPICCTSLSEL